MIDHAENESNCKDYFAENGHTRSGKCKKCSHHRDGGESAGDVRYWCLLAHGAHMDESCHQCPGIGMSRDLHSGKSATQRVLDFLVAYPGVKFYSYEICETLFLPYDRVLNILKVCLPQRGVRLSSDLCRDEAFQRGRRRFWLAPQNLPDLGKLAPAQREALSPLAKKICAWFKRHHHAARPSVIAAQIHDSAEVVARELDALHQRNAMLRCELLLRDGVDRYEYRSVGVV